GDGIVHVLLDQSVEIGMGADKTAPLSRKIIAGAYFQRQPANAIPAHAPVNGGRARFERAPGKLCAPAGVHPGRPAASSSSPRAQEPRPPGRGSSVPAP